MRGGETTGGPSAVEARFRAGEAALLRVLLAVTVDALPVVGAGDIAFELLGEIC